jgi:hypothetical protein
MSDLAESTRKPRKPVTSPNPAAPQWPVEEDWVAITEAARESALERLELSFQTLISRMFGQVNDAYRDEQEAEARNGTFRIALISLSGLIAALNLLSAFLSAQAVPAIIFGCLTLFAAFVSIVVGAIAQYDSFRGYSAAARTACSYRVTLTNLIDRYQLEWTAVVVPFDSSFFAYKNATKILSNLTAEFTAAREAAQLGHESDEKNVKKGQSSRQDTP